MPIVGVTPPRSLTSKRSSWGSRASWRQSSQPTPGNTPPYLWPLALIETTHGSRKSHTHSGPWNGPTHPAGTRYHDDLRPELY